MNPEQALRELPSAPPYDASVVPLLNTRSVLAYKDEQVSKLVWCIKYKKNAHAVEIGGYILWKALCDLAASEHARNSNLLYIILSTPITAKRRRERGYNQCELILDEIQRLDALHGQNSSFIFEKNLLIRTKHMNRQTLKGRDERLKNAAGIFGVDETVGAKFMQEQAGKRLRLIVIDDVITTGSTLKAALDALTEAGFGDVCGLSIAH